jgi:hypothetical protein
MPNTSTVSTIANRRINFAIFCAASICLERRVTSDPALAAARRTSGASRDIDSPTLR